MTAAVAYLRVSSESQAEGDGFDRQMDSCKKYASRHNIAIVETYEESFTGTSEERPEFQRMLNDCADAGVSTILIERMDRWCRKFSVGERLIEECRQRGLTVIDCSTGESLTDDDPDPDVWFMTAFRMLLAEWDKRKLTYRMKVARDRQRQDRGRCEGRKPYGEVEGDDPAAVDMILRCREEGESFRGIAERLHHLGFPTQRGGQWRASTVRQLYLRHRGQSE